MSNNLKVSHLNVVLTLSHDWHGSGRLGGELSVLAAPHLGHSLDLGVELDTLHMTNKYV
jgi:hypothetical protein